MASPAGELIVLPPVAEGRLYPVQSGPNTYFVDPDTGECDCPWWMWRCASHWTLCKHGRAVAQHLQEVSQCPACRGKGRITPTGAVRYVGRDGKVDMSSLTCLICEGTGKR